MTDDYDERTRLMTWRVAILALTILVSGGLSPVIRNALGLEWGYRGVGLFVGSLILIGTVGAWWGTRNTQHERRRDRRRQPARPAARWWRHRREFRTLLTVFVLQALATGAMLAGVDYVARVLLGSRRAPRRSCSSASSRRPCSCTPLWQRVGEARGKRTGYIWGSLLLAGGALATLLTVRVGVAATAASVAVVGRRLRGLPDVPARDAPRRRRRRHRAAPARAAPAPTPACGPRGRPSASPSARSCTPGCSPWAATSRRPIRRRAAGLGAHRHHPGLHHRSRPRSSRSPCWSFAALPARPGDAR